MTYVIVNTKGNYRGLNGKRLRVVEQFGNFISCQFLSEGKLITADFGKSEVVKIWESINIAEFIWKDF